jgi:uncharacterized MAPEG superfamily protein
MNPMGSPILLYCVVAVAALIYLPFLVVAYARVKIGYEQSTPRAMFDKLPPYAQRATWAHENSFEVFTIFAPAALMAYVTGQNSSLAVGSALTFTITRLLYSFFYIFNIPVARSLMFGLGSACSAILFVLSLMSIKTLS